MKEYQLKYGCNPNQKPARVFMEQDELPFTILNGSAGYINLLDAFNAWQLVKELKQATGLASAASFKHVSPAGAAVAVPLSDRLRKAYYVKEDNLSDIATAYIRARGADRMSSYGDFAALSDTCDAVTARYLKTEVSDGIIAPDYTEEALEILKGKRRGKYLIIKVNPDYEPEELERKQVFGVTFEQLHNNSKIDMSLFEDVPTDNKNIPLAAKQDMILSLITLKYTQSNSVCYVKDGQAIGIGAGQQSRIHCTRLAGDKADVWWLRQHDKVLGLQFKEGLKHADMDNAKDVYINDETNAILKDGEWQNFFITRPEPFTKEEKEEWLKKMTDVSLGSDAFFPFGDNIERAYQSGVKYISETGGSIRDQQVIDTCDKYGIAMAFSGIRLFHH